MDCVRIRKEIEEADNPREVVNSLSAHLSKCEGCRAIAEQRVALYAMVGDLERVSVPSDFDFRLSARLKSQDLKTNRFVIWRLGQVSASVAGLAAAVILLVVVGGYFLEFGTRRESPNLDRAESGKLASLISVASKFKAMNASELAEIRANLDSQKPETTAPSNQPSETAINQRPASAERQNKNMPQADGVPGNLRFQDSALTTPIVRYREGINEANAAENSGIALAGSDRMLQISVPGTPGTKQRVALRSVTFGSQQLLDQPIQNASYVSGSQGIW